MMKQIKSRFLLFIILLIFCSDSGAAEIALNGTSITVNGSGVTVSGSTATITSAGTHSISGTLSNGQIIVDTSDSGDVILEFNGIDIYSSSSAPVYVLNADNVIINLKADTENFLTDSTSYTVNADDEPDAALFSKDDLELTGSGSLTVDANYNNGIKSKDTLIISGGNITVTSVDDGIIGKDYISITGGNITVNAQGDGLKSTNDSDTELGYISIDDGTVDITSGADAIQVETDVIISGGDITILTAGGHSASLGEDDTAKGIKSPADITITGGNITIDSADDCIHSNDTITINGGTFVLASGDDAVHSDTSLEINNGDFDITWSYEGLESGIITINDGTFHILATDDGINVAGGNDSSGTTNPGMPGSDFNTSTGSYYLYINGGFIFVNTGGDYDSDGIIDGGGDGVDSNGSIEMTGGTLIINGPISSSGGNGALDYDGSFKITGGLLLGAGSSSMAQIPGGTSTQYSVLLTYYSTQSAGTMVHVESEDGEKVFTFAPANNYNSIVFSSPDLEYNATYYVYYGGSSTGTSRYGLYEDGFYVPGKRYTSFPMLYISEGVYRCGSTDSDSDGVYDCVDDFPNDGDEWLDTDLDGTGNNGDEDDDNDGMPDEWETAYGLNPFEDNSSEDPDEDGYTNLEEYLAGTVPTNSSSYPLSITEEDFSWRSVPEGYSAPWTYVSLGAGDYSGTGNTASYDECNDSAARAVNRAAESALEISAADPGLNPDLSEQEYIDADVLECGSSSILNSLEYIKNTGITDSTTEENKKIYGWSYISKDDSQAWLDMSADDTFEIIRNAIDNKGVLIAGLYGGGALDDSGYMYCNGNNSGILYNVNITGYHYVYDTDGTIIRDQSYLEAALNNTETDRGLVKVRLDWSDDNGSDGQCGIGDSRPVYIELTDPAELLVNSSQEMEQGWNLYSVPVELETTGIQSVLENTMSDIVSVWAYKGASWKVYDPTAPDFSDLTVMEPGSGYWINADNEFTLSFTGTVSAGSLSLEAGWNLVGYNTMKTVQTSRAVSSISDYLVSVWAYKDGTWKVYDPAAPDFSDLTAIEPGYGYWINTTDSCTWTLP